MTDVVINDCFGGFSLSDRAVKRLAELGLETCSHTDLDRDNKLLVRVVRELGQEADGSCAALVIVNVPDDVKWHVHEYDGIEHVAEDHRTWS